MGGATVPTPGGSTGNLVFPSQAEPNPIPFGLRGQGPEQFITPTATPAGPGTPAQPNQPAAPAAAPGYSLFQAPGQPGIYSLLTGGNIYDLSGSNAGDVGFLSALGYNNIGSPTQWSNTPTLPTTTGYNNTDPNLAQYLNYYQTTGSGQTNNPGTNRDIVGTYTNNTGLLNAGMSPQNTPYSLLTPTQAQQYTNNPSVPFANTGGQYSQLGPSNANSNPYPQIFGLGVPGSPFSGTSWGTQYGAAL
jgi:hypothetical protein